MNPSFIIAGATQSGMENLQDLLTRNSAIFLPKAPPSFFSKNQRYAKGIDAYQRLFAKAYSHQITGDLSPTYFEHGIIFDGNGKYLWSPKDDSALRVKKHFPQPKIVMLLRNPVERAFLQYEQARKAGRERCESFEAAVREELSGARAPESHAMCYLYRNAYAVHVEHWRKLFGKPQLHIALYEDLKNDPASVINGIENFIGVRPRDFSKDPLPKIQAGTGSYFDRLRASSPIAQILESALKDWKPFQHYLEKRDAKKKYGAAGDKPDIDPALLQTLHAHFRPDVEKLQTLIDRPDLLSIWELQS